MLTFLKQDGDFFYHQLTIEMPSDKQDPDLVIIDENPYPVIEASKEVISFVADKKLTTANTFHATNLQITIPPRSLVLLRGIEIFFAVKLARLMEKIPDKSNVLLMYEASSLVFKAVPSRIMVAHLPPAVIAAIPIFEDKGIASRIASLSEIPGCFDGDLASMVTHWEAGRTEEQHQSWQVINVAEVLTKAK